MDIIPTAMTILKNLKKKHKISVNFIENSAMEKLLEYDWPGNVREMENTLERIVLIHDKPVITEGEILSILNENKDSLTPNISKIEKQEIKAESSIEKEDDYPTYDTPTHETIDAESKMTLKELEKIAILAGLKRTNWNMSTTAQQLGISRMTLYRKLDQHNIDKNG